MNTLVQLLVTGAGTLLLPAVVAAQAASNATHLLAASEAESGGSCRSINYALLGSLADLGGGARSTNYQLAGGFPSNVVASTTAAPWLTAARPLHVSHRAGTSLTLTGVQLRLGSTTQVLVAGRSAQVTNRSATSVTATIPRVTPPGWQQVDLRTAGLVTALVGGVGVLPLIELERPAQSSVAFAITYRGRHADNVMWLASIGKLTGPVPIPGIWHGLLLDPTTLLILPRTTVVDPGGVLQLPLPAVAWSRPILVQAVTLSKDPSYGPACFTNLLEL